jgi:glycosyltransferase involved in cell wall biosynthesis
LGRQIPPVRVTFLIGSLEVGGAETQLVRLANGLDRNRFSPSIICLWQGGELEDSVASDVPVIRAELPRSLRRAPGGRAVLALRILATLVRTLRKQRPDVVHAYLPAAYVLGGLVAWMLRVRIIIASRRGLTSFESFGSGRWLAKLANSVIDVQICNSRAVRDWAIAKEGLTVDRLRVIPNGIELPPLQPAPSIIEKWETTGVKAAMVANLIRYKGHHEVLQSVAVVAKRYPTFRLVLIGDGPELTAVVDLARELAITDNVIFAGRLRGAADLMLGFDFTVLGSSEEGFPNALMESMARGIPVVATAVGGVGELVEDGIHGLLVPYGDTGAMATAILWMIEHPDERRTMGASGRARIAGEFSTERMVSATQAVYDEMLHRGAPDRPSR